MNAIILAGGKGGRLGEVEKAFLKLGGESFIEYKLAILKKHFGSVIIVTNKLEKYRQFRVSIVRDELEGRGPLMGLYCGLKNSQDQANFVTTCDTPFLKEEVIELLCQNIGDFDAIVPCWHNDLEPLLAIYSKRCIPFIEREMDKGRVISFFPHIKVKHIEENLLRTVDPEGLSFFNVNTIEDYKKAVEIYEGLKGKCRKGNIR